VEHPLGDQFLDLPLQIVGHLHLLHDDSMGWWEDKPAERGKVIITHVGITRAETVDAEGGDVLQAGGWEAPLPALSA
jgi:hypothetical protein